jgi:acyl-coenzyme A synthetase/AMP-(fatty) acid ligase
MIHQDTPIPVLREDRPDRTIALEASGRGITVPSFVADVWRLADRLPEGGHAFVLCQDRYHFLVAFCANLLRGTVNLLPPAQHPSTLADIAADYPGCRCLVDASIDSPVPVTDVRTGEAAAHTDRSLPSIPAGQVAAIAFTSGSTGRPVAHRKHWGTLVRATELLSARLVPGGAQASVVATVPSQHMYGLETTAMMALHGGCALYRGKPFYPQDVRAVLERLSPPVLLVSTPFHLRALVSDPSPMPAVWGVVSATAPLERSLAAQCEARFGAVLREVYGCTEAGSLATRHTCGDPLWHPLDGIDVSADAGGGLARAAHLTEPVPLPDQLAVEADGRFRLLGRNADMVNVAGKRASLADLTLKLQGVEGIRDAVVFLPEQSGRAVERPAALVVTDLSPREVARRLADRVDPELVPRPIRRVPALPRNETGKVPREALAQLWAGSAAPEGGPQR